MEASAKVINYYNYGTAAPAIQPMIDAETKRVEIPQPKTPVKKAEPRRIEKAKSVAAEKNAPGISVFAVLGTLFVTVLMVFVVLAQINFNETAGESIRLNAHINELTERQRELELAFERAIDIQEVERFARDELGMSRPAAGQVIIISTAPRDSAIVTNSEEEYGLEGFGTFIRSLTEYFRR